MGSEVKVSRKKARKIVKKWVEENEGEPENFNTIASKYSEKICGYRVRVMYRRETLVYLFIVNNNEEAILELDLSDKLETHDIWDNSFVDHEPEPEVEKARVRKILGRLRGNKKFDITNIDNEFGKENEEGPEFSINVQNASSAETMLVKVICDRHASNDYKASLRQKHKNRIIFVFAVPSMKDREIDHQLYTIINFLLKESEQREKV